jgi:hypothetical protein
MALVGLFYGGCENTLARLRVWNRSRIRTHTGWVCSLTSSLWVCSLYYGVPERSEGSGLLHIPHLHSVGRASSHTQDGSPSSCGSFPHSMNGSLLWLVLSHGFSHSVGLGPQRLQIVVSFGDISFQARTLRLGSTMDGSLIVWVLMAGFFFHRFYYIAPSIPTFDIWIIVVYFG